MPLHCPLVFYPFEMSIEVSYVPWTKMERGVCTEGGLTLNQAKEDVTGRMPQRDIGCKAVLAENNEQTIRG